MSWRSFKYFCQMRAEGKDDATYRSYDLLFHGRGDNAVRVAMVHMEKDAQRQYSTQYLVETIARRLREVGIYADVDVVRTWLCEWSTWHKINTGLVSQWPLRKKEPIV